MVNALIKQAHKLPREVREVDRYLKQVSTEYKAKCDSARVKAETWIVRPEIDNIVELSS